MAVAGPHVHLLAQMLDQLLDGVVMVTLRREFFFRVVGRGGRRALPAVDAALRNARVEVPDEARVVEAAFGSDVLVVRLMLVAEQRVPLSFRGYGIFVVAVVLRGPGVGEILVIRFVLVDVVQVVRKEAIIDWRGAAIQ